ncbi:amino acid ABC transporter ATP-binding protein [Diaminobutyricibacter sp. McL0608]|uniref:amino acid ABC transporter ATP-binding protein n=1 Tax=Leifsonia sp. McL0608 TaxID=3143537 RepID=UPI0031F2E69C
MSDATGTTAEADVVLRVEGLYKSFGTTPVLRGIDLEIDQHQVVVAIGASGSGKSTLLKTINLLERVDDGRIFLKGEDISDPRIDVDRTRARIGVVFQQFNLFPHLSVLDNVTLASRKVHGIGRDEAEATALGWLERIGLGAKVTDFPDRLSGGQQQRVAIIRAIVTNPELLLLDEITSALDPLLVGEVLDLVAELKAAGSTILMTTHEMQFARTVADHIIFLHNGVLLEQGPPEQVFDHPRELATQQYLARVHSG